MMEFGGIWIVFALFMVRIGIPFIVLITLGTIIDNRERRHQGEIMRQREQNQTREYA